jgi:hypothetical protein
MQAEKVAQDQIMSHSRTMASGSLQYVLMDLRDVTFFDVDGLEVIKSLANFCKKNNMTFGIRTQRVKEEGCHKMLEINNFFSNDVLREYLRSQKDTEEDDLCTVLEKL